jgi:hypothetical protein
MSNLGRPIKKGVDWFSHDVNASDGRTLFTLESLYGNDGYAFWFKLLELLGQQATLSYEFKTRADWLYVAAKMKMNELQVEEILNTLSDIEAIDQELWKHKIVWSQNFVDRLGSLYKKRTQTLPNKPKIEKCEPDVITSKTAKSKSSDLSERKADLSERKLQFSERELDNNSISTISTKVDITPYSPPSGDDGVFVTSDQTKQHCENLTVKTADGTDRDKSVNHSKTSAENDFDRFWEAYPKKVGKKNAQSAWKRLKVKPPLFERIMSALEIQKQSDQWLKEKGRFVPNPSTWLNGERWEDSIESMNASEKKKAKRDYYSEPDFIDLLEESRRKEALNVAQ